MELEECPAVAGWRHHDVRTGFEVVFYTAQDDGHVLRGRTTAIESGSAWSVGYRIELDRHWRTVHVVATTSTATGESQTEARRTEDDQWFVDGALRPELTGCVDIDLESSAVTNTLPIHRLAFRPGESQPVPAAFVRADDLRVERVEQDYALLDRSDEEVRFAYASSTFAFACTITYDPSGLVLDYPGIAVRDR